MNRCCTLLLCALAFTACGGQDGSQTPVQPLSVVITGGKVYSGENREGTITDIGIVGDRVVAVGDLSDRMATTRIDASGLVVSPGFIDTHSHAVRIEENRGGIFVWPDAENLIRQGVTTVIGGPDGGSPLPLEATFTLLEENPASVNFGSFVGAGSVRAQVVGPDDRPPTPEEMQQMREVVAEAMEEGAFGLSSGLIYAPGRFATTEEVIELAKVAARYDGIYISHMRNEGRDVRDSIRELIRISEEAGLPAQITHHKVMGRPMWGSAAKSLALVDRAVEQGLDITSDQYPYAAGSTGLTGMFPGWALAGDEETRLERLRAPEQRALIRNEIMINMREDRVGDDPSRVAIANCKWNTSLNGSNLAAILETRGREVSVRNAAELAIEMQEAGGCSAVYHAMDPQDVEEIMRHPRTMIASDGGVEAPSDRVPHPRNYGAFARVLGEYVREQGVLRLHTALHKMSMMPAERLGLSDRGRITEGAIADIAIFDPTVIGDKATFSEPHQYAVGMHHVLVGGELVLADGEMTGRRPGRVIRAR